MNNKLIIANAVDQYKNQKTPYTSYFTQNAKINKEQFVEFVDFFNGCKHVISQYKKDIENQFNKDLNGYNFILYSYSQMLNNGETIDANGNSIQESIKRNEADRDFILTEGYENNTQYKCCVRSDTGEIVENRITGCFVPLDDDSRKPMYEIFELLYSDLITIEKALVNVEIDFIEKEKILSFRSYLKGDEEIKDKVILSSNPSNKKKRFENIDLNKLDNLFVLEFTIGIKPTTLDKLKNDLSINIVSYNKKQIVAIASILYSYLHKNVVPKKFSPWLRQFCEIIDIQAPTSKKNAVKLEIEELKKTYWYLIS
ncbi:MAG: hypothetical protein WCL70_01365 [Paludibacter sp.]